MIYQDCEHEFLPRPKYLDQEVVNRFSNVGHRVPGHEAIRAIWYLTEPDSYRVINPSLSDSAIEFMAVVDSFPLGKRRIRGALNKLQRVVRPDDVRARLFMEARSIVPWYIGDEEVEGYSALRRRPIQWQYKLMNDFRFSDVDLLAQQIGDSDTELLVDTFGWRIAV